MKCPAFRLEPFVPGVSGKVWVSWETLTRCRVTEVRHAQTHQHTLMLTGPKHTCPSSSQATLQLSACGSHGYSGEGGALS